MARNVIESHFEILSQGISHFYSMDIWEGNIYRSILMKHYIQEEK